MTIIDGFLLLGAMLLMLITLRWQGRQVAMLEIGMAQLHHDLELLQEDIRLMKLCLGVMQDAIGGTISPVKSNDRDFPLIFNERKPQ